MKNGEFVGDRTGSRMVEIQHCSFDLDPTLGHHLNIAGIVETN
jgi:hypothetical protein